MTLAMRCPQALLFNNAETHAERLFAPLFYGGVGHPVNDCPSADVFVTEFVKPLKNAFSGLRRQPLVAVRNGDVSPAQAEWEIGTGYFVGHFDQPLFGIPPHQRTAWLRYTEMVRFQNETIAEWYLLPDFIDLFDQVGINPLRPSLGSPGRILPPESMDGLYPSGSGAETVSAIMAMLEELGRFDGVSLGSMDLAQHWDPDFLWYGPAGIGTTRGIEGFRRHHQGPFLRAFPDRVVDHHASTVGAGSYAATGGWPHMHATHSGSGWLGLPATGTYLSLRVMDIWRREDGLLKENWVGIDIPHMLVQMGLDIFEQMKTRVTH